MRKTLVAIATGAGAVALLGAGSATAVPPCVIPAEPVNAVGTGNDVFLVDSIAQGNCAENQQQQQQQNNVWTQQNQPEAEAAGDSSAASLNAAGANGVNSGALNGNGIVFSGTQGGTSLAIAANANVAVAPQVQRNLQLIGQLNLNSTTKASVYNSAFTAIGQ